MSESQTHSTAKASAETPAPSTARRLVSVVFSLRNEEQNLEELLRRLREVFADQPEEAEFIFVNDDSNDRTLEILTREAQADPRVKALNMSRRFGVSECALAGMEFARGDALVYMDSDLQDPPELIAELLEKWRAGADVVHTVRLSRAGEPALKLAITAWAYRVIRRFANIDIPVNSGDFKLLSRRALDALLELKEESPYLRGLVCWVGFRQEKVFYHRQARHRGETQFPLFSVNPVRFLMLGIISFSALPLYLALGMGLAVSLGSALYLVWVVVTRVFMEMHQPGWSALMATMLFIGGITLFTNGILGLYIARIFAQVRGRPRYIVESVLNGPEAGAANVRPLAKRSGLISRPRDDLPTR